MPASHWLCVNVLLNNITFCDFCCLFLMCAFFNVAVNKCINWCFVHLFNSAHNHVYASLLWRHWDTHGLLRSLVLRRSRECCACASPAYHLVTVGVRSRIMSRWQEDRRTVRAQAAVGSLQWTRAGVRLCAPSVGGSVISRKYFSHAAKRHAAACCLSVLTVDTDVGWNRCRAEINNKIPAQETTRRNRWTNAAGDLSIVSTVSSVTDCWRPADNSGRVCVTKILISSDCTTISACNPLQLLSLQFFSTGLCNHIVYRMIGGKLILHSHLAPLRTDSTVIRTCSRFLCLLFSVFFLSFSFHYYSSFLTFSVFSYFSCLYFIHFSNFCQFYI